MQIVHRHHVQPYLSHVVQQPVHISPPLMHHPSVTRFQDSVPPPPQSQPQTAPSSKDSSERDLFYAKLHAFREEIGEPIQRLPTLGFKELDLWILYKEVVKRGGIDTVIAKKQWKEVAEALQLPSSCTDSGFRLRLHYKKYLEGFERKFFEPPSAAACSSGSTASPTASLDLKVASALAKTEDKAEAKKEKDALQRASSSVTSTGSMATDVEVVCAGTSSVGSARCSGPVSSSSEASSRVEKAGTTQQRINGIGPRSGIVKKKKRTNENAVASAVQASVQTARVEKQIEDRGSLDALEAAAAVAESKRCAERGRVDFSVLDDASLQRYAKVYDVKASGEGGCSSKKELAACVAAHFSATPLSGGEHATLLKFIKAIRRR